MSAEPHDRPRDGTAMPPPRLDVGILAKFKGGDLDDICEAAELAIRAEGGFGWLNPPAREVMERYWRGVLVVPERTLFAARLDGVVVGSIQLVRPPRNNEAQAMAVHLNTGFIAPWARGHGLMRMLLLAAEDKAREERFAIVNMDIRQTQEKSIALFEAMGYTLWGVHPAYATVDGVRVPGLFYFKDLTRTASPSPPTDRT
jgi:RimJ/RimL family protein N-acetyltransferase